MQVREEGESVCERGGCEAGVAADDAAGGACFRVQGLGFGVQGLRFRV